MSEATDDPRRKEESTMSTILKLFGVTTTTPRFKGCKDVVFNWFVTKRAPCRALCLADRRL